MFFLLHSQRERKIVEERQIDRLSAQPQTENGELNTINKQANVADDCTAYLMLGKRSDTMPLNSFKSSTRNFGTFTSRMALRAISSWQQNMYRKTIIMHF